MKITPVKRIIFDNDGVNIDSEDVAMQVMDDFGYDLVKKYITEPNLKEGDIYAEYPGTSTDKIVESLISKFSLPVEFIKTDYGLENIPDKEIAEALADKVTLATNKAFSTKLNAIVGIAQALREIDIYLGGIENRALCTTSREDRMKISLECAVDPETGENASLAELFPDEDNRRLSGYGHDNKYSYFLELHPDWDPSETVVVEDSLSGVKKAKAANSNFRVIGTVAAKFYTDKKDQISQLMKAGADIVVTDVADLPKAIEWLDNGLSMDKVPDFKGTVHHSNPLSPEVKSTHPTPITMQ